MKNLDIDKLEDLQDDLAELMEDQAEIQEVMTRSYQVDYDESELMDELNELDEDIVNEQLNDGLNVPSYVPQQHANPNANAAPGMSDEDQLSNMMQI